MADLDPLSLTYPDEQGQTHILLKLEAFITQHYANHDASHDAAHTLRVRSNAMTIAKAELALTKRSREEENIFYFIIQAAALLHDVDDSKYAPAPTTTNTNTATPPPPSTTTTSVSGVSQPNARSFLTPLLHPTLVNRICDIICGVSYSAEAARLSSSSSLLGSCDLETACVQDADRLEAIGAIGIARCFTFGGNRGRPLNDGTSMSSISHFYDKLLKIKHFMKTNTGKKEAEVRSAVLETFLTQFHSEWDGKFNLSI